MDKERAGAPMGMPQTVPPGIAPKLPDPAPLQPKKGLSNRELLLVGVAGVLIVALATWFIVFALSAAKTPQQAIDGEGSYPVQQAIVQVSTPGEGERYLNFYISGDVLACALLQRGAGGYKVLDVAGDLALTSAGKQGIWMPFGLKTDRNEYYLVGLIYDSSVTSVEVDGVPAVVVDNGVYRCWYFQGEGSMTINSESVVFK